MRTMLVRGRRQGSKANKNSERIQRMGKRGGPGWGRGRMDRRTSVKCKTNESIEKILIDHRLREIVHSATKDIDPTEK